MDVDMDDVPSEYIDLMDPSFNQLIGASDAVDLWSHGSFREKTIGVHTLNGASETLAQSSTTSDLNTSGPHQMNGVTSKANDTSHKCIVNYEDVFANTSVHQDNQSKQLAHFDLSSVFDVQLDMDLLDDISKTNPIIQHAQHELDEFVSSDPIERLEFYSECVNLDVPGEVSACCTVNNEADQNSFGETDEAVVVFSTSFSDSAEGNKICESSIVIDVNGALSVNHETVEKQADVGAANVNILNMEKVDASVVRQSVEEFLCEKAGGSENSTLNGVVNFLETREDEGVCSTVTYFLNSKSDGSVEVEMSYGIAADVTDHETVNASHVEVDDTNDSESESGDAVTSESDSDLTPVEKFQIFPLGSNNYRDTKGYLYTQNSSRHSHLYLRCKNNVKYSCKARVTIREQNYADPLMTIEHNHHPDNTIKEQSIFDKKLEANIREDPFEMPRRLYLKTKEDLLGKIDPTNIPPLKKREGFIHRRQKKYIPRLPSTIEEFEKSIADEKYRNYFSRDHRNLPYYRGVWTSAKGERNLVFISETVLKKINEMNNVAFFIDGTYKALPHHLQFRQLYVINVIYEDQSYPFAYIFMEKKTFTSYDTVFGNLKLLMPSVSVARVMSDYEAATRKAVKKHYPNAKISGCFFHYVQAIVKRAKKMGLRRDAKFSDAVKQVCALALLPNDFVVQGFKSIEETFKIKSKRWTAFKKYWMKQWSSANISVYGLVDRTNNFSESNNKSLNLLLQSRHPNIWILIKHLKSLENDKSDLILRSSKGEMKSGRDRDMIRLNQKIEKATKLFEEDEDVQKFLRRVTFEENLDVYVKDRVNIMDNCDDYDEDEIDDDEVIPNDYNVESDFRKSHPRAAAMSKHSKK